MKNCVRFFLYCLLVSLSLSETLLVPETYSRIQRAIDSAVDGDTILVNEGTYCENLIINKSITLTSYAIFENLDNWLSEDGSQVQNEIILNTIIDGSESCLTESNQAPPPPTGQWLDEVDHGSVILVVKDPEVEDCITPEIFGLTIQGGYGTKVSRDIAPPGDEPVYQIQRLGGGVLSKGANPTINFNQIKDNDLVNNISGRDGEPGFGGGINSSIEEDFGFINYHGVEIDIIQAPSRCDVDEFNFANNFFYNNDANYGRTLSNKLYTNSFNLSGSSFDVASCESEEVSTVWIGINESAGANYSNIQSTLCAIREPNVYIDSNIENECLTQNCGTEDNPFKTIKRGLAMILPVEGNPITLNLANGNYSPNNGEIFPILTQNFVSFKGEDKYATIIDANQTGRVFRIENTVNNKIESLTISGGQSFFINETLELFETGGGGIFITRAAPSISDVFFSSNYSDTQGAALSIVHSGGVGSTKITNSDFAYNVSESALYFSLGSADFYNVRIYENENNAVHGGYGGMKFYNSIIHNNGGYGFYNASCYLYNSVVTNHPNQNIFISDNSNIYANNSIIYTEGTSETYLDNNNLNASYSNIHVADNIQDYDGEGNININPEFNNNDFSLGIHSPCIDQGNPDIWYNDIDQTRNDMGAYGGPFFNTSLPGDNNTSYNFGVIGVAGSQVNFKLYNYRQNPIIIENISFSNPTSFYTNIQFPLQISPYSEAIMPIVCSPQNYGFISNTACIESDDISQGACLSFSATVFEGNLLAGDLSGELPIGEYEISSDIFVQENNELIIQAGTKFLFHQDKSFDIWGTVIAEGTENDSIIFTGLNNNSWEQITINEQDDNSIFKYCKISHATGFGSVWVQNASPTFENCTFSQNNGYVLNFWGGNVKMLNTLIVNNTSFGDFAYIESASPIIINSTFANNSSGGGMLFLNSSPIFINSIIYDNCNDTPDCHEFFVQEHLGPFNPTAYNCNFKEGFYIDPNFTDNGGMYEWNEYGENNISAPPQFINPETGNFRLQANSECIDAGLNYFEVNGEPIINLDASDYYGQAPDIGVYEWYPSECGDGNCSEDENYEICPDDCEIDDECGDGNCSENENYETCPSDCSEPEECEEGYVIDCSGDGDCCDEDWIGDDYLDCEDQLYGCDLTCYDNDGGDCGDEECTEIPNYYGYTCADYVELGYTCYDMINIYEYDCSCTCDDCEEIPDINGFTCGDYVAYGYSCEAMIYTYLYDCSCSCNDCSEEPDSNGYTCNDFVVNYNWSCEDMISYGYDCSCTCFGNNGNHNILDIVILVDFIINSNNRYIPLSDYNEDGSNDILDIIEVTKLILRN